jgi:hypothetical protein
MTCSLERERSRCSSRNAAVWYAGGKVKGKVVPVLFLNEQQAIKAYCGSGGIAPRILDLGTRWRWVVSFTPRPPYPQGKSLWYLLARRLAGSQRWSGRGGEEKNSQPMPGLETPNHAARIPALYRWDMLTVVFRVVPHSLQAFAFK